jgi:membrane protease YdiL (CAAX protease family)
LWAYLILIATAELVTSLGAPMAGIMLHIAILVGLLVNTAFGFDEAGSKLVLALTLGPLIRILSLTMPLRAVPQVGWYPLVSVPLLITTWVIIRHTATSREALGLRRGNLLLQLGVMGAGLGLGALEYVILRPEAIVPSITFQTLLIPFLSLLIFTGFTEELIFRGLMQSLALPVLGRQALSYVALLFGVLHIGYLSVTDVVFVTAVGFLFAYLVRWGASLLGVTFAHGLTNTMLFLVLPYLNEHPEHPAARVMPWMVGISSAVSLVAMVRLWWQARPARQPTLSLQERTEASSRVARTEASSVPSDTSY